MANQPADRFHIILDVRTLDADEKSRENLNNSILQLAPNSQIFAKSPFIQQAVTTVGSTFAAYKAAGGVAAASAKQAKIDAAALVNARKANNKALILLRGLTENDATSVDDIKDLAFEPWTGKPPVPAVVPPDRLDIKLGKKGQGKATVSAYELGKMRGSYVAEGSTEPIGPNSWSVLPGSGKSRKITGKSGTSLWVRFALVRGQRQSEWSAPVLVTFP